MNTDEITSIDDLLEAIKSNTYFQLFWSETKAHWPDYLFAGLCDVLRVDGKVDVDENVPKLPETVSKKFAFKYYSDYTYAAAHDWYKPDGTRWWPDDDGATPGTKSTVTLTPNGELGVFGRTGNENGRFVAALGTDPHTLSSTWYGL